jgi:hypothetical protein
VDSDDKMMIHQITEEKPNAATDVLDEDEHMVILACLLQLHAKGGEHRSQTWMVKVWVK